MTAPTRTTERAWQADVLSFADARGLTGYLDPVLGTTRRLFPGRNVEVAMQADREIPDDRYIAVWVDGAGMTADQLLATERQWATEVRQLCSGGEDRWFFLGMYGSA